MNLFKHFLLGSIFFALTSAANAQQSVISGYVNSAEGEALSDVHVYLSATDWAITDQNGFFSIETSLSGTISIKVSRVGYESGVQSFNITSGDTLSVRFDIEKKIYSDAPVVVTASRTEKNLEDVSVPVTVIDEKEISMSGNMRLSDVLDEQIGLNIVSDHGTGIQVQGFDPEYTLIMIDNQPVIGRTAGTLDLTRLAVGNIKQIEIVKGPASALWGSEALAGVINIITDKGSEPFGWDVTGRYGDYETFDGSTNLTFKKNRFSGRFFANINGSEGYDLSKASLAPTVAPYTNYTLSGGADYRFSNNLTFKLGSRYFREDLSYLSEAELGNDSAAVINSDQVQEDYNITPEVVFNLGEKQLFELTGFISRFNSQTDETVVEITDTTAAKPGDSFYFNTFDQTLNKLELKSSTFWNNEHTTIAGTGGKKEDLVSENYADIPGFKSFFVYGQHEWQVFEELSLTGGFRFDAHSEYNSQLSPKFSGLYKPNDLIHIRASFGGGFKAPAFNQLFLNFTNATVGYSVFGTSTVVEGMQALQQSGRIDSVLIDPSKVTDISAENSLSYNFGFDLFPLSGLHFTINFFRNNIQDMIDTQRIAFKTNEQSVFSYFNLNKVYTQGFETELEYTPDIIPGFNVGLGYQYLDARQEFRIPYDVIENGRVVSKTRTEYGILPNRSAHTGNIKLFYVMEDLGLETSLRATYRGRFGEDLNGNGRIESNEYVFEANNLEEALEKTILNASIAKTFKDRFRLMVGVDNITNFTDARYLPSNPGRTIYTQLNIKIQ